MIIEKETQLKVGWYYSFCCHCDLHVLDQEAIDETREHTLDDETVRDFGPYRAWPTKEDAIRELLGEDPKLLELSLDEIHKL